MTLLKHNSSSTDMAIVRKYDPVSLYLFFTFFSRNITDQLLCNIFSPNHSARLRVFLETALRRCSSLKSCCLVINKEMHDTFYYFFLFEEYPSLVPLSSLFLRNWNFITFDDRYCQVSVNMECFEKVLLKHRVCAHVFLLINIASSFIHVSIFE